jgi:hypothetical protein
MFFKRMLKTIFVKRTLNTFDGPSVDWSETGTLDVIARETIDLSPIHGAPAEKEQFLGRHGGGAVVLYVRERSPRAETYSKTTLPEPLLEQAAMLLPCRPAPVPTYNLMLQPENIDAIVALESQRTSDGQWKNRKSQGTPICVPFESADRERLEALRRDLFGKKAADSARIQEERQQRVQAALDSLSPDERSAAMLQMMMQMRQRMKGKLGGSPLLPADVPPEIASLHDAFKQKVREVDQRAKEQIADTARRLGGLNPEIERLLRLPGEPDAENESAEP